MLNAVSMITLPNKQSQRRSPNTIEIITLPGTQFVSDPTFQSARAELPAWQGSYAGCAVYGTYFDGVAIKPWNVPEVSIHIPMTSPLLVIPSGVVESAPGNSSKSVPGTAID